MRKFSVTRIVYFFSLFALLRRSVVVFAVFAVFFFCFFFLFFLNPCKDYTQREGQDAGKLHPCPSCSHVCIRRLPSLSSHESHFSKEVTLQDK